MGLVSDFSSLKYLNRCGEARTRFESSLDFRTLKYLDRNGNVRFAGPIITGPVTVNGAVAITCTTNFNTNGHTQLFSALGIQAAATVTFNSTLSKRGSVGLASTTTFIVGGTRIALGSTAIAATGLIDVNPRATKHSGVSTQATGIFLPSGGVGKFGGTSILGQGVLNANSLKLSPSGVTINASGSLAVDCFIAVGASLSLSATAQITFAPRRVWISSGNPTDHTQIASFSPGESQVEFIPSSTSVVFEPTKRATEFLPKPSNIHYS